MRPLTLWLVIYFVGFAAILMFLDLDAIGQWPAYAWGFGWLAVAVVFENVYTRIWDRRQRRSNLRP
jgi:hypothetical protein